MKFIKTIIITFTTWVLNALINCLLSGTWLSFVSPKGEHGPALYLVVFVATMVLSVPGYLMFWIVFLTNRNEKQLFKTLLKTGMVIASLSSLILFKLPANEIKGQEIFVSICIIISTIASIMIHHTAIKSFDNNETEIHA